MHLAVSGSSDSWYAADLMRAAAGRHTLATVSFRRLAAAAGMGPERFRADECELGRCDAVLVRSMPAGSLEQVVFRMDVLARLEAAGVVVVNPPKAVEAAVDKYLATTRLAGAGLLVPRTIVCQTVDEARVAFCELGGDVVVKPLFGAEGRGIARLTDEAIAERAFQLLAGLGGVIYLQEFIPHKGCDLRLLVIGDDVLAMRRTNHHDWRTNVARGAAAAPFTPDATTLAAARAAAAAIGASVAGVDLLPGHDGRLYAIEVNAVPGWKALAGALEVDVARRVLEHVEDLVDARRGRDG